MFNAQKHLAAGILSAALAGQGSAAFAASAEQQAVQRYIQTTTIPCYKLEGESRCRLSLTAVNPRFASGRLEGDPRDLLIAFIPYQYDVTGNAMDQMAVLFAKEGDTYRPITKLDHSYGSNPANIRFSGRQITYSGTVMKESDYRANPTGKAGFALQVAPDGRMRSISNARTVSTSDRMR